MSEERFEVFGNIIKDNKDIPVLLNNYQATVRLNELNDKVKALKQELAKKQNTIDEINKEFVQAIHDWKTLCAEKDKEIESILKADDIWFNSYKYSIDELKQNQTQLAIQELAEVERLLYESHYKEIDGKCYAEYEDIKNLIDSRIKALEKEDA